MALIEEFENQGNFLFRWRSYIPGIILILCLLELPNIPLGQNYVSHWYYMLFCLTVGLIGLLIRILTIGFTPYGTSGRNTKKQVAEEVNSKGIYSLVRHPLYLGNFFMYFGVVLVTQNLYVIFLFITLFYLYYERIMFAEESFLRNKFGKKYLNWANSVPTFIPSFKNYKKSELSFSFKNIIKREYPSLAGLVFLITFLDLLIFYFNNSVNVSIFQFYTLTQPIHNILFGSVIIFYIFIRSIVKYTKILEVKGR